MFCKDLVILNNQILFQKLNVVAYTVYRIFEVYVCKFVYVTNCYLLLPINFFVDCMSVLYHTWLFT